MAFKTVEVESFTLEDNMYHKDNLLLHYKIEYPQFKSSAFRQAIIRINTYYKIRALAFERYCCRILFGYALENYEYSVENGYPIRAYEAVENFEVTYNDNCTLSLYIDRYVYTGGANGNVTRYSDTWSLKTGRREDLDKYIKDEDYAIEKIIAQITEQMAQDENMYFENYRENAEEEFDDDNFYLKPQGVVIFYQMYSIAPRVTGIPEFLIPYKPGVVKQPRC